MIKRVRPAAGPPIKRTDPPTVRRFTIQLDGTRITVFLSPAWSSPKESAKIRNDNRAALEEFRIAILKRRQPQTRKAKMSLRQPQKTRKACRYFTSISHTQDLGGFAIASRPVGFDLEMRNRTLSPSAAKRIGPPAESQICGTHLRLWVAKEAAWKALKGPKQPGVISQIGISGQGQVPLRDTIYFSIFNKLDSSSRSKKNLGVIRIVSESRHIVGLALLFP